MQGGRSKEEEDRGGGEGGERGGGGAMRRRTRRRRRRRRKRRRRSKKKGGFLRKRGGGRCLEHLLSSTKSFDGDCPSLNFYLFLKVHFESFSATKILCFMFLRADRNFNVFQKQITPGK